MLCCVVLCCVVLCCVGDGVVVVVVGLLFPFIFLILKRLFSTTFNVSKAQNLSETHATNCCCIYKGEFVVVVVAALCCVVLCCVGLILIGSLNAGDYVFWAFGLLIVGLFPRRLVLFGVSWCCFHPCHRCYFRLLSLLLLSIVVVADVIVVIAVVVIFAVTCCPAYRVYTRNVTSAPDRISNRVFQLSRTGLLLHVVANQ